MAENIGKEDINKIYASNFLYNNVFTRLLHILLIKVLTLLKIEINAFYERILINNQIGS